MTELLVGTKKGLFVLEGEPAAASRSRTRAFAGRARRVRDARPAAAAACSRRSTSPFYGPKIFCADDAAGEWQQAQGVALPEGGDAALERIWVIVAGEGDGTLYAGGDPGVLFESHDGGASWAAQRRALGAAHAAELAAGRRRAVPALDRAVAGEPDRLARGDLRRRRVADRRRRRDVAPRQRRPRRRATCPTTRPSTTPTLCVHDVQRAPARPERMFMQFHGGVYRSDDAGESWTAIGAGPAVGLRLPARGRPGRPRQRLRDPAASPTRDRVTPDGRVRVYETRDAGASWTARGDGLPEHAYLPCCARLDRRAQAPLQLYFGRRRATCRLAGAVRPGHARSMPRCTPCPRLHRPARAAHPR